MRLVGVNSFIEVTTVKWWRLKAEEYKKRGPRWAFQETKL